MDTKKRIIIRILRFMEANGITIHDLQYAQNPKQINSHEMFDLLCVIDEIEQRVPFEVGKNMKPKAIFPFAQNNIALDLKETEAIPHSKVDKIENLMSVDFCKWASYDIEKLNQKLKELGKPVLEGCYHVYSAKYLPECCWFVQFGAGKGENLPLDIFDDTKEAKVRYVHHFST